jgi:death on curing protein
MRHLTLAEVLDLHERLIAETGGKPGIRELDRLVAAAGEPRRVLAGSEVHTTADEKAAALGFSLLRDRPFLSANRRLAHAAMETFLHLNGLELRASPAETETILASVWDGLSSKEGLMAWLRAHMVKL